MKRLIRWLTAQSTAVDVTPRPVAPSHHRRHTDTPVYDRALDLHGIEEPHVALTAEEVRRERVRLARLAVSTIGMHLSHNLHADSAMVDIAAAIENAADALGWTPIGAAS